jgi:peptide/nickel transport system permease protein
MQSSKPLGVSSLAMLKLAMAIIELNIAIFLFLFGNPLPWVFPTLDVWLTAFCVLLLGFFDLVIAYNLWNGQAFGWVMSIIFMIIDVLVRIALPILFGTVYVIFAFLVELDIVILYYISKPHVMPFFGGKTFSEIYEKFKVEIEPQIKELKFTLHLVKKSPLSIVGMAIVLFYAIIAICAPVLAPPGHPSQGGNPYMMPKYGILLIPQPPSPEHPFGTMEGQYDIYYGCIWGTRTAFRMGIYVVAAIVLIGLAVGVLSGYYGGWIDEIIMRFTDIILAFPGLILCMAFVVIFVPMGMNRLDAVMLALVLVGWPGYARLIRGEVLRVKSEDFVEAAKSVGCSDLRVIVRHILPNSIYPIVVSATLDIGTMVLSAAALSFLGLGADPGTADWGWIINLSRNWIYASPEQPFKFWYTFIYPGLFISFFVLGWNLLGDAIRDILDPTLRRK